ncbi:MAG: pro-sigmaK processing inhibitor BofA family protein, partial [Candidatus Altiarchaeota archaeon]
SLMVSTLQAVLGWFGLSFSGDSQSVVTYILALIILAAVFSKLVHMFKHWIYNTITGLAALLILTKIFELNIPLNAFTVILSAVFGIAGVLALLVLHLGGVFL